MSKLTDEALHDHFWPLDDSNWVGVPEGYDLGKRIILPDGSTLYLDVRSIDGYWEAIAARQEGSFRLISRVAWTTREAAREEATEFSQQARTTFAK